MAQNTVYVTKKGLKKLEDELTHLQTTKRLEVASRLREAMEDGELIENAEYEAAKNEQAFVEGRILELEYMVSQAQLIQKSNSKDFVTIGSTVEVKEKGGRKSESYKIVGAAEANPKQGLISNESPMAMALLEHKIGDVVEVQAPSGAINFRIIKIK